MYSCARTSPADPSLNISLSSCYTLTMNTDEQYINMALEYARQHAVGNEGQVGAVLVRDGQVISSGASNDLEGIHAEQAVLGNIDATGTTAYVTIQPSLYRSDESIPSDSEVLIAAGVSRVVVGSPNTKYPLEESVAFFKQHNVEFVVIRDEQLSQECLDLFVTTGADQTPRVISLVGLVVLSGSLVNAFV